MAMRMYGQFSFLMESFSLNLKMPWWSLSIG